MCLEINVYEKFYGNDGLVILKGLEAVLDKAVHQEDDKKNSR